MAESTVSGPFRSENGFQQLDENGEWVPVTGGGGGGVTSIIAGAGISVSAPTGAVTISATGGGGGGSLNSIVAEWGDTVLLAAPTAVGQIYRIDVKYGINETGLPPITIQFPVLGNGFDSVGITLLYAENPNETPTFVTGYEADMGAIQFAPPGQIGYAVFELTYVGVLTITVESYNIYQGTVNSFTASPG